MANRKISDLTSLTAPATGDLLPIVDISEAAAADKNKKITYGELLASAPAGTAAAPSFSFEGDSNTGIYSPGADQVAISTNGTRRLVVDANGNLAFGSGTIPQYSFLFNKNITGAVSSFGIVSQGTIQSDVTTSAILCNTFAVTQAAAFTLADLHHFRAQQATFGAGSTVTNQYGFSVANSLNGATNNYGFYSALASSTNRWNFYAAGTADSYFASNNFIWANGGTEKARIDSSGRLGIGTSAPQALVHLSGTTAAGGIKIVDSNPALSAPGIEVIGKRSDNNTSSCFGGRLLLSKNRTDSAINSGSVLGSVAFGGNHTDGTEANILYSASIVGAADGTFNSATDMPTALVFNTGATGRAPDAANVTTGTERLRITSAGLVGIGTSSPIAGSLLDVRGGIHSSTYFWDRVSSSEATATRGLLFTVDGVNYGRVYSPNGKSVAIQAGNGTLTDAVTVDQTGRVGIGTATPANNLDLFSTSTTQIGVSTNNSASIAGLILSQLGSGASTFIVRAGSNYTVLGATTNTPVLFSSNNLERMRIDSSGRLLVGTSSDSGGALLQVNGDRIRVGTAKTPATSGATGTTGEIAWDADYIYVCTATNTWKRSAIATW